MNKKIWISVGIVACVIAVIVVSLTAFHPPIPVTSAPVVSDAPILSDVPNSGTGHSQTWSPTPADTIVPNVGSGATTTQGTAVPAVAVAAAPDSTASFRSFSIQVAGNAYTPNTVIVNKGDTVNLEISAIDGNYGFTQPDYGLNSVIKKGKTQKIQFQALTAGKFTFYCATCGGPAKGPVGYIIVK
jgi:heme/copper-type cytochrome/quinol oxidase subunit 2